MARRQAGVWRVRYLSGSGKQPTVLYEGPDEMQARATFAALVVQGNHALLESDGFFGNGDILTVCELRGKGDT